MFITENRGYFKDYRMREMDEKLGDIYGLICGRLAYFLSGLHGRLMGMTLQRKKLRLYTTWLRGFFDMKMCLSTRLISGERLTGKCF